MKEVVIAEKVYKLAYNLKSLFMFEEIAGRPYEGKKTIDTYLLMYSMLLANNEDFAMDFDEFIAECDKNYEIYHVFIEVMDEESKRISAFKDNKKKAMIQ